MITLWKEGIHMNENVKKVLEEQLWYVATCGDEPNVVSMGFKKVMDDAEQCPCQWKDCYLCM